MEERPGFMLYYETLEALDEYTEAEAGRFVRAVGQYARYGVIPDFEDRGLRGLWRLVQPKIDRDDSAYSEKCRKNRYNSYVSAEKRAYRKKFPGKSEPIEGVDYLIYEDWIRQIDEPNASERKRTEPNASDLKPTITTTQHQPNLTATQQNMKLNPSENENQKWELGEFTTSALYDLWVEAVKAGDNQKASQLATELFKRGYNTDKRTLEIKERECYG